MKQLRSIENLNLQGKKVFLRLDLNVPLKDGKITDSTRIDAALPTIKYLLDQNCRVVMCSHLGRPKGERKPELSLEPVGEDLANKLGVEVVFIDEYFDNPYQPVLNQLSSGQIMLLENLRFYKEETSNDDKFSQTLAEGIDFYINDAFGTCHRAHASTEGVAKQLPEEKRAAGFLVAKEINALSSLSHAKAPFSVVMGGSKVSDKLGVILSVIEKCNHLLIGGAMAYTLLKYNGISVGSSRVEDDKLDLVKKIYDNAARRNVQIHLPVDHIAGAEFSADTTPVVTESANISEGLMGLDIGPKTIESYRSVLASSKTILWNGPMGVFEWDAFSKGSLAIADEMAKNDGTTIIGGGDSVAATNLAGVSEKMTHVSTGGGASLEFLEGKALPGIRVLMA